MVRQSLIMQQNFNTEELAEEKELFSDNDIINDLNDFSGNDDFQDDFLGVEMAVYSE